MTDRRARNHPAWSHRLACGHQLSLGVGELRRHPQRLAWCLICLRYEQSVKATAEPSP